MKLFQAIYISLIDLNPIDRTLCITIVACVEESIIKSVRRIDEIICIEALFPFPSSDQSYSCFGLAVGEQTEHDWAECDLLLSETLGELR